MSQEPERFLSRWSRRKLEAKQEADAVRVVAPQPVPAIAAAPPAAATATADGASAAAPSAVELPPIESLDGLKSDYAAFFQQPAEDSLRRAALRKLFGDPHFNVMDGLDVYVEDYTQFEPIPEPLRQRLVSAEGFLNRAMPEAQQSGDAEAIGAGGDRTAMTAAAPCAEPQESAQLPSKSGDADAAATAQAAAAPPAGQDPAA